MTQYLVTTFKDSTGRKHTHITRAKSNQRFTVVEAESKEEAKEKYVYKKAQAFDEILEGMTNAIQHSVKEGIELDEAVGIMAGQVVYKYEEE
ncbi:DUF1024 family protein [Staphylococcus aureus]